MVVSGTVVIGAGTVVTGAGTVVGVLPAAGLSSGLEIMGITPTAIITAPKAVAKISQPGAMERGFGVSGAGGFECLATVLTSCAAFSRRCSTSSRCFISPPPSTFPENY
jgi:hypothetical protein